MPSSVANDRLTVHLNFHCVYHSARAMCEQLKQNQKTPTARKKQEFLSFYFCSAASHHPEIVDKAT